MNSERLCVRSIESRLWTIGAAILTHFLSLKSSITSKSALYPWPMAPSAILSGLFHEHHCAEIVRQVYQVALGSSLRFDVCTYCTRLVDCTSDRPF